MTPVLAPNDTNVNRIPTLGSLAPPTETPAVLCAGRIGASERYAARDTVNNGRRRVKLFSAGAGSRAAQKHLPKPTYPCRHVWSEI
jgi:hypothetical protein